MIKILVYYTESQQKGYQRDLLESIGAQVRITAVGFDTKELPKDWSPDLIVLDLINLEGAVQTCQLVKELWNVPLLVLCLDNPPDKTAAILDSGADDCLSKPMSKELLIARIQTLLRRKHSRLRSSLDTLRTS